MAKYLMTIKTPRATINVHTVYASIDRAEADGWGIWFQHENYLILGRDDHAGAVVKLDD